MTTVEKGDKYLMNTYARFPVALAKGSGMTVAGEDGKEYLDFGAGFAVNALGHASAATLNALTEQAGKLIHASNLYYTAPQADLAEKLVENSCFDKTFFCNSGAEAVEASLKLARKYGNGRAGVVAMRQSFHGRTFGALTATGQPKYQQGFAPLVPGFTHVPLNDFAALEAAVGDDTCAVIVEPVQGEGGIIPAKKAYLEQLRALCSARDIALIFDEVQCGVGRTGHLFAYEHFGVEPDIVALAKGLAGGVPVGAMLAKDKFAAAFHPGDHASTFGGNPLAAAVAYAVLGEVIALLPRVRESGAYLARTLDGLKAKHSKIVDTRGVGLMRCIELDTPVAPYISRCIENGLLLISSGANVIRFVPPLIVEPRHIDAMAKILDNVLTESLNTNL